MHCEGGDRRPPTQRPTPTTFSSPCLFLPLPQCPALIGSMGHHVMKFKSGRNSWRVGNLWWSNAYGYFGHTGKKIWTHIGVVWPNKSGKGFNLTWDYLPLGDGLTVMLPYDKKDGEVAPPEV